MKKARYEQEKAFMVTLRGVGCTVGEYVGDGAGEAETAAIPVVDCPVDIDPGDEHQYLEEGEDMDVSDRSESDGSRPLLILFDCETTGLSIYSDHITDIGAKVLTPPVPLSVPTFSCLVRTGRTISTTGKMKLDYVIIIICSALKVSRVTGITNTLLRGERPLSVVMPMFLEWLATITSYVSEKTSTPHYPGMSKFTAQYYIYNF